MNSKIRAPMLSVRQRAFCEWYVINKNAARAAVQAGYTTESAPASGTFNLANPYCQDYIQQLMAECRIPSQETMVEQHAKTFSRAIKSGNLHAAFRSLESCIMRSGLLDPKSQDIGNPVEPSIFDFVPPLYIELTENDYRRNTEYLKLQLRWHHSGIKEFKFDEFRNFLQSLPEFYKLEVKKFLKELQTTENRNNKTDGVTFEQVVAHVQSCMQSIYHIENKYGVFPIVTAGPLWIRRPFPGELISTETIAKTD